MSSFNIVDRILHDPRRSVDPSDVSISEYINQGISSMDVNQTKGYTEVESKARSSKGFIYMLEITGQNGKYILHIENINISINGEVRISLKTSISLFFVTEVAYYLLKKKSMVRALILKGQIEGKRHGEKQ